MKDKKLENILDKWEKKAKKREAAKIYRFPLWPEPKRGIPNYLLRSALFSARKKMTEGGPMRDVAVFSQGDIEVKYTGQRLTQAHLDVYEGVMHLAREQKEGAKIYFTACSAFARVGIESYQAIPRYSRLLTRAIRKRHKGA